MKKTCCCCVSTILFIIILIVGVFFGGTWYAYDKYGKDYCGITYGEVLGLVPGLYKASEKKIVTNPFNEDADLATFDAKMKKAMFVTDESKFSIKAMLDELLNTQSGGDTNNGESGEGNNNGGEQPLVNQSTNGLLELLKELNFDFSTLKGFEIPKEGNSPLGVVSATDKEIAALFSAAFSTVLDSKVGNIGGLEVNTSELLQVKQVIISGADEGAVQEDVRLTATLKLDISATVKAFLAKASLPSIVSSLATTILPKNLFVSLVIAPYAQDVKPIVSVNQYSDKNNGLLMEMIKNIINKMGNDENKFDNLFNSVDGYIKTVFTKVKTMVDMKFVGDSAELDAIYTMMSMMKINVSKNDFLEMISFLQCRDLTSLEALNYEKAEIDNFMHDLKRNYAINDSLGIDKTNLTTKLGQVPNNLDLSKLDLNKTNAEMSVLMKYDAMIEIFAQELAKKDGVAPASATTDILKNIVIRSFTAAEVSAPDKADAERIRIVVELKLKDMLASTLGNNAAIVHLASQLLPDKIFLTFEINLSGKLVPDLLDGKEQIGEDGKVIMKLKHNSDASLLVNDLNAEQSVKLMATVSSMLGSVGGESLAKQMNIDELKATLSKTIRDSVDKLENQAKGKIDILFTKSGVVLPTIYELVGSMFNLSSTVYDKAEMPDQVRLIIKGLQVSEKTAFESNIKYESSAEHNGGKIIANYTDMSADSIKGYSELVGGVKRYYLEATAELNIYDKNINHIMSKPFVAGGATIALKQTVFADTTLVNQGEVMSEKYYADLIANAGFSGKIVVQTADINIENLVAMKNPLIPSSLYMTYVYSAGSGTDEKPQVHVVVNGLSAEDTIIIEQIISSAQNKPFSFETIINDAVAQSLNKSIEINLPKITVNMPSAENPATINPLVISLKLNDLIKDSKLSYIDVETEEFKLGTAKLAMKKSETLEIVFGNLTDLEQAMIDALFPAKK